MADRYRIRTNGAIGGRRGSLVNVREANPAQSVAYGSDTPGFGACALDANGIGGAGGVAGLSEFCYSRWCWLRLCGRCLGAAQVTFWGLLRLLAKELRQGTAANVERIDTALETTEFCDAYVSGQDLLITSFRGRFPLGA
jgi:hypothetical protein